MINISPISTITNSIPRKNKSGMRLSSISFQGQSSDVFQSTIPTVTKLTKKEFKRIYPIYLKYRESAGVISSISEVKKYLNEENKRTDDEIFTACIGEKPIGFLHFGKEYSTLSANIRYKMKALFVDKEHRGKGVAKSLIQAMQKFAGDKEIIVKARRTNEHSPFLYPRTGFHEDSEYIHFVYKAPDNK